MSAASTSLQMAQVSSPLPANTPDNHFWMPWMFIIFHRYVPYGLTLLISLASSDMKTVGAMAVAVGVRTKTIQRPPDLYNLDL
jgi:hypothetical protein